ncbi:MAG: ATP/GTP-binding protein [Candidatus Aramenus sulfurataquae]|uniref:ATP/GTP-binding protein n=3 Tax=Candidatus Aramenus sulfurataquae TaxID=1326980 RepID=A0AAE3FK77_9CREN|nr:ATP/GTP-binding protein [Candidatus Aramenus sulfurataquae]
MRLLEFYTNNFRSLSDISLSSLGGFNVILGFNGYGKTNLLTAVYVFVRNLTAGIEKRSAEDRNQEFVLLWQSYDTSKPIFLGGKLQFSEQEVEKVTGKIQPMAIEIVNKLSYVNGYVEWDLDTLKVNGTVPSKEGLDDVRKLLSYASGQIEYVPIFDQEYFDNIMKRLVEISRSPINLRKYWYDFVNLVSVTIPEIKGMEIWDSRKLVLNVYNLPIYIDLAASGFQRVILMLFIIWLSGNKILLIEEPEVNMHPTLQYKVVKLLKSWTDAKTLQVFLTTHSPFIVSSDVDNYIVLRRNSSYSKAISVLPSESLRSLLSILKVRISDLLFSKTIILCNEYADPNAISNWLKRLNVNPEYNGISIYSVKTDLELQSWLKLRDILKLDVIFLGLCDKLDPSVGDRCIPLGREVESFYSKTGILEALKTFGIYPDDKELKDLGKEDNLRWLINVLRKRGLDYSLIRSSLSDIVTRIDSIEIPKEVELLANKIKSFQVIQ